MSERDTIAADGRHEIGCVKRYGATENGERDTDAQADSCECHTRQRAMMENVAPRYSYGQLRNLHAITDVRLIELERLRAIEAAAREATQAFIEISDQARSGYYEGPGLKRFMEIRGLAEDAIEALSASLEGK